MLYRKIERTIEQHLKSGSNKILLVDGARQIGKTYIIRYVGNKLFENYIEINNDYKIILDVIKKLIPEIENITF